MIRHTWIRAGLAVSIICAVAPLYAQTQRSGGGEAQKIMQQYQQVAAEKTALQTQAAQMKKDLDAAKAELATVKQERDAARKARASDSAAAIAQANGAKEAAERTLDQSKQRMSELVGKFREMAGNLKEVEADRSKLRDELAKRNTEFDTCAVNNAQLGDMNSEILDRYEHVGLFTKASAAEPFTRITRTRIENLADEYRARARELKVKNATP